MNPGTNNISMKAGADWTRNIYIKDDNGTARDLTGYTARMQIRPSINGAVLVDLSTEAGGGIVITPAQGLITISIGATDTAKLPMKAIYDLFVYDGMAATCLLEGDVNVRQRVTR